MAGEEEAKLEIRDDPQFQRRQLLVERVTVAAFAVVILLGLRGLFGSGRDQHHPPMTRGHGGDPSRPATGSATLAVGHRQAA